jgi:outer membrane lipoprotein-sorting protein
MSPREKLRRMESRVSTVWNILLLSLFLIGALITKAGAEEKGGLERWMREAEAALVQVENYRAIFHKQERVEGRLMEEETVLLKFKRPFKVYMKWIKKPYKGRELLYVEGWNDNRMMVRDSGIMGIMTVNINPKGSLAMKGNRHPVTESGLDHLVKLLGNDMRRGVKEKELEFKDVGEEILYGRRTRRVEVLSPRDKARDYYCYRAVLNLDLERRVPIKIQIYDWENNLIENYGYEDLRFNVGISDADFSPKNPEYKF